MTDNYGDRRKEARKIVVEFTLVYESKKGRLLGYLRDLTMSGAQVSGKKKLDIGTQVFLSIELPNDLPGITGKDLRIKAEVARCITTTENPVNYAVGFKFIDLQPEQNEVIEKLIRRYHFRRHGTH